MTCLGVLDRGERGNDNGTRLKEGGGIEMSTTVLSIYAMHALLRFEYLPDIINFEDLEVGGPKLSRCKVDGDSSRLVSLTNKSNIHCFNSSWSNSPDWSASYRSNIALNTMRFNSGNPLSDLNLSSIGSINSISKSDV